MADGKATSPAKLAHLHAPGLVSQVLPSEQKEEMMKEGLNGYLEYVSFIPDEFRLSLFDFIIDDTE